MIEDKSIEFGKEEKGRGLAKNRFSWFFSCFYKNYFNEGDVSTMKAAVYYGRENVVIEERDIPQIGDDEILLKVKYCSICGTDVRIYSFGQANVIPPRILGHEITGVVDKVGKNVSGYVTGENAILAPAIACGTCKDCGRGHSNFCTQANAFGYSVDGGFAEYIRVPSTAIANGNLIKLAPRARLSEYCLAEPLSCVINGQQPLNIKKGDQVLVIGAGPIGAMHVLLAKANGANVILADIDSNRLELAGKCGADLLINSKDVDLVGQVKELTNGNGVDVAITACSVPIAQEQALKSVGKGGRVSFFAGLPKEKAVNCLDMNIVHYNEVSIHGAYGSRLDQNIEAYKLLTDKTVDAAKLITHVLPLEQLIDGFNLVKTGQGLKVVIEL
ncbi:zinc-dependent dehydrogenase [Propionispora vibrioides]|uniref:L-iditol 2-dehydrogenase n=1 Tax=Propionispora vibrioides TaxID=112903 RepID=A0A1H8T4H1_9FIRM|nr:zinc-dependent dehydrogenase [Propionispora vibrioides]SEO85989.1 L-iditol 2-dehydrogenase [Propionispora vibrioides]